MQSPPKTFGTPTRKIKRHKANNYNPAERHNWTATENPMINYSSPPRKRAKTRTCHTAPSRHHSTNITSNDITSSPISSRYQSRIAVGTSLYDSTADTIHSPLRAAKRRKTMNASPISPTFQPLYHSPSGRKRNHLLSPQSCDRFTPNHGNLNRYHLHSPTKRFVHNAGQNMMSYTNVIAPSPQKRRKLGQNYSGTNDDPSSLNHRLKQKLSQHTYNQVLQSELLGFAAEHTNIVNQIFNNNNNEDDTERNDNISSIQHDEQQEHGHDDDDDDEKTNDNINIIFGSPSLPNRRIRRVSPQSEDGRDDDGERRNNSSSSHHPLCPCYKNGNDLSHRSNRDDHSVNSEGSGSNRDGMDGHGEDMEELCVCDSITSNVATNFLVSPQRTLRYNIYNDQENIGSVGNGDGEDGEHEFMRMTPIKTSSQSVLSGSRKSMRNIAKSPFKVLDAPRLTDDFYLNLVDWSTSCNILSVGLGECVYLWSAYTSKVTKLTDLSKLFEDNQQFLDPQDYQEGFDMVCSVGWSKNHESALNNCSIINNYNNTPLQYGMNGQNVNNPTNHPSSTDYLAVGSGCGYVFVFDTNKSKLSRSPLSKHSHRVGVLSWRNNNILASGSRDRHIYLRDIRINDNNSDVVQELMYHKQEVCGLKWSEDSLYLASGGNDNKLAIWDIRYIKSSTRRHITRPLCYGKHKAAVKAITWSPHESGLLATGGGTADRCIKFWNINHVISSSKKGNNHYMNRHHNNGNSKHSILLKPVQVIDTGSQVCNLLWSRNVNEIVSTHGYSLNQIVVWKYPTMDKIVTLTGHTYRVLYLAGSPDGQTVVTGAGDETLRLWNIFPPVNQNGNGDNQSNNGNNNNNSNWVPRTYSIPLHIR